MCDQVERILIPVVLPLVERRAARPPLRRFRISCGSDDVREMAATLADGENVELARDVLADMLDTAEF